MSYVDRIKNDPVMNAVFNSKQKMQRYITRSYWGYEPATDTIWYENQRDHLDPARNPRKYLMKENIDQMGPRPNLDLPHYQQVLGGRVTIKAGGPAIRARNVDDPTIEYRRNPNLYWINMLPKDLYNINHINSPNPIIGSLKNLPVHISSLHKSFA